MTDAPDDTDELCDDCEKPVDDCGCVTVRVDSASIDLSGNDPV